jgi:O-6-methylguanine DNA methyltransferase
MMKKKSFSEKVISVVSKIKPGKTMTYTEVAGRTGNSRASRAVGNILNKYYHDCVKEKRKIIPCHRVIRSDGRPGGYAKGEKEKRKLLEKEKAI